MKAIVQDRYGSADVLKLKEIDRPEPGAGEVLVRVQAAALHAGDLIAMWGRPYVVRAMGFGLRRPRKQIPGFDLAGRVEAIGSGVTRFRPGDEVFGFCRGGLAEYVAVAEDKLAPRPASLTAEQAAAVPTSGVTALQAVRDHGKVQPGQRVLINGASGGVGTFAVQIAGSLGADVTGVCSTANVDLVRSIGAAHVIDYTSVDFTAGDARYDLIIDNVANRSLADCRRLLASGGTLIPNNGTSGGRLLGTLPRLIAGMVMSPLGRGRIRSFVAKENSDDLLALAKLIEGGSVTPVIDQTFPLDQAPDAARRLETGHARGKIVVTVQNRPS